MIFIVARPGDVPFPWQKYCPSPRDLSSGYSPIYKEWLKKNAEAEAKENAAKTEGPEDKGKRPAAPSSDEPPEDKGKQPAVSFSHEATKDKGKRPAVPISGESETGEKRPLTSAAALETMVEGGEASASSDVAIASAGDIPAAQGLEPWMDSSRLDHGEVSNGPIEQRSQAQITVRLPPVQPATRSALPSTEVPNRYMRTRVWNTLIGTDWNMGPICGPFEIKLPAYLAFEHFVLGPDGSLATTVHERFGGMITIAWASKQPTASDVEFGTDSVRPERLIVGFSSRVTQEMAGESFFLGLLDTVWGRITRWAVSVYERRPLPLATYLDSESSQVFAFNRRIEPMTFLGPLYKAYTVAQENAVGAAEDIGAFKALTEEAEGVLSDALGDSKGFKDKLDDWAIAGDWGEMYDRISLVEALWLARVSPAMAWQPIEWGLSLRSMVDQQYM